MTDPITRPQELARLERELAYSAARSDIECFCLCVDFLARPRYYDIGNLAEHMGEDETAAVERAVRYLEARKLLERKPDAQHLARLLDNRLDDRCLGAKVSA